jgi:cell division protein FtsN
MSETSPKGKRIIINIESRTLKILLILNIVIFVGSFLLGMIIGNISNNSIDDNHDIVKTMTSQADIDTEKPSHESLSAAASVSVESEPTVAPSPPSTSQQNTSRSVSPTRQEATERQVSSTQRTQSARQQRGYTIQVISLKDYTEAIKNRDNLRRFGLDARIMEKELATGKWYRVRIGSYPTEREAYNAAKQFEEKGIISSFWVSQEEN